MERKNGPSEFAPTVEVFFLCPVPCPLFPFIQ